MKPVAFKRYVNLYREYPKSRIFAPLAHIYRRMGEWDRAFKLCEEGLKEHPDFASGHIVLALLYLDRGQTEKALASLQKATRLSPENILAHKFLARCHLKLKNLSRALNAYKRVLFLDPENSQAAQIVKKLEPLTIKDYEESGFAFKSLTEMALSLPREEGAKPAPPVLHPLHRVKSASYVKKWQTRLSVAQALIYRSRFEQARDFLHEMKQAYTHHKEEQAQIQNMEQWLLKHSPHVYKETKKDAGHLKPHALKEQKNREKRYKKIQILFRVLQNLRAHPS